MTIRKLPINRNSTKETLYVKVQKIISSIPDRKLAIHEFTGLLGSEGLLILISLLSLFFLIPVSVPGVSTAFGLVIFFISISYILGKGLWLPKSTRYKTISGEKISAVLQKGLKWIQQIERISKPHRMNKLITNKISDKINGISILLGSLLLMLPLGFLPFSNTFPAIAILFFSIGILQKDGIIIILGHLTNFASIIYFTLFFSTINATAKQLFNSVL